MNDLVDRLANEAAHSQLVRSGTGEPSELGPADVPVRGRHGGATASRLEQVPGWRLVVLGHRPPELGGYDPENPVAKKVREKLVQAIVGLHTVHPDLVVLTGIGLGAEMLGAEAAELAGVRYVAVLAYP